MNAAAPHEPALSIPDFVRGFGIEEVLHFTTNRGLVGIGATGAVKSRDGLTADAYLEHIYLPNCRSRAGDAGWTGYVNLSLTQVNGTLLGISKDRWHVADEVWWCVLAFDPALLSHDGVYFTTTNNIYPAVKRGQGGAGLAALYADKVPGRYGNLSCRTAHTPRNLPTDPQAEVLYPDQVELGLLRRIYVPEDDYIDAVKGLAATLPSLSGIPIECKPEVFG